MRSESLRILLSEFCETQDFPAGRTDSPDALGSQVLDDLDSDWGVDRDGLLNGLCLDRGISDFQKANAVHSFLFPAILRYWQTVRPPAAHQCALLHAPRE